MPDHPSLSESFLAKIAGWEAMKRARALLAQGDVLSSNWTPPVLKGAVRDGELSLRSGLVLRNGIDIENFCACRASRQWGQICAHSVAVGLHHLDAGKSTTPADTPPPSTTDMAGKMADPAKARSGSTTGARLRRAAAAAGLPLEVCVIIPPNFQPALARGKVMICFEGKWPGSRMPLDRISLTAAVQISTQDEKLLGWIEGVTGTEVASMVMVDETGFARLLEVLVDHPRVSLGRSTPCRVTSGSPRPDVASCEGGGGFQIKARLEPRGEIRLELVRPARAASVIRGGSIWMFDGAEFQSLPLPGACSALLDGPMTVTRAEVPVFLSRDWPALRTGCEVLANFGPEDFQFTPQPPKFHLHLAGGLARLEARLQCAYGSRIMTLGVTSTGEHLWLPDPDVPTRYSTRDPGAETAALERLRRFQFHGPDAQGRLLLTGQDAVLRFFALEFPRLEQEWSVALESRLERSTAQHFERIEPRLSITSSGERWFDLDVAFETRGGDRFSAADIQRLLLSGQSHARLRNGKFALLDTGAVEELQAVLLDCNPEQSGGRYRMDQTQAAYLNATMAEKTRWTVTAPTAWQERARRQAGQGILETPDLGDLDSVLRPYQKHGVAWMHFLRQNGFGGILADEMGLGKTVQALACVRATPRSLPTLVVCPASLVFNWLNEARKFVPSLRITAIHGPRRQSLLAEMPSSDLVVTSYPLIRRDAEHYRGLEFDTVILDEAQHIKNRQSQNAQAVKSIRSRHRLVLTGTPLENSVLDLWSIFDFLMPGYLGTAQDFRERYEAPIARDRNADAQARLARRVRPFLLRRLKRDVAKDLPGRIEQVSYCELTDDQRAVYQEILQAGRREALEAAGRQGSPKARLAVLNALLRLRQICCDLRLLNLENVDPARSSGKLDLFGELLEEVIDGGHRALVFSQFVSLLKLVEARLKDEAIEYCYLDGSTQNRAEVVNRFQARSDIPVFLISLKAGGTGLNLTGADTVIHLDPWWNPAVEDQATDRAHRLGQTRVVTSYKLITRDTVEEKILSLQERKREVIRGTLGGEDEFSAALSWDEIVSLLDEPG